MKYFLEIQKASENPKQMEDLYQTAQENANADSFQTDLIACYEDNPGNILLAAWFYRLQQTTDPDHEKERNGVNWRLAILLSLATGLFFWLFTDESGPLFLDRVPYLVLLWAPIATFFNLVFLARTAGKNYLRTIYVGLGLLLVSGCVFLLAPKLSETYQDHYLILVGIHLPILSWVTIGISVLGFKSTFKNRFPFLVKSTEAIITAGVYLIFGAVLGGITFGMFAALNVDIPELWMRLIVVGGYGLLPTLAVASIYDPTLHPGEQDFSQGLSKFVATMMRLLLPLTLAVLVIYIFVIPFNFMEPFRQRDVLIVYNLMLFAVMGLLMGATPIRADDISEPMGRWLRNAILAVAILAVLISIYAMSATVYRTVSWGITINRLVIIGWNIINIGILVTLVYKQLKHGFENWVVSLQQTFSLGTNAYVVWSLFILVVIPLIF
ncbi:MAG: hypothetical protein IMY76_01710 [Chloroflexi bacterium]|nr:hypothetical protein [Chloroflexota bacterium]